MLKKYLPDVRKRDLLMSSVFGSACRYEQLFNLMKNVKSRTRMRLTDGTLGGDAYELQQQKLNLSSLNVFDDGAVLLGSVIWTLSIAHVF
jgi:hypothetical protein